MDIENRQLLLAGPAAKWTSKRIQSTYLCLTYVIVFTEVQQAKTEAVAEAVELQQGTA